MVRLKHRYLLLNILYPQSTPEPKSSIPLALSFHSPTPAHVDAARLVSLLKIQISYLFGDLGLGVSLSSLKVVYFSNATSTAILRVPRNHHRLVWAALSHVTEIPAPSTLGAGGKGARRGAMQGGRTTQCVIRVVRVSGTIRKVEEALVRRARIEVVRAKMAMEAEGVQLMGISNESASKHERLSGGDDVSMDSIDDFDDEQLDDDDESD